MTKPYSEIPEEEHEAIRAEKRAYYAENRERMIAQSAASQARRRALDKETLNQQLRQARLVRKHELQVSLPPLVRDLLSQGMGFREIARTMNEAGHRNPDNKPWIAITVARLLL